MLVKHLEIVNQKDKKIFSPTGSPKDRGKDLVKAFVQRSKPKTEYWRAKITASSKNILVNLDKQTLWIFEKVKPLSLEILKLISVLM